MNLVFEDEVAEIMARNYVCSNCWGSLVKHPVRDGSRRWLVLCRRCGPETKGYVTRYYAEKRQSESIGDRMDVERNLRGVIPNQHAGKTTKQLLEELGIGDQDAN